MINPRFKIQEIVEAYNLEFEAIEYGNGWPYNFTANDKQSYPIVFFVNPAQGVREQWYWRWNVKLWIVDQVKDIAQPINITNPVSDSMLNVADLVYRLIETQTEWDLTGFGVRELQRKGDHNVTGWEVTFTALIPAVCEDPTPPISKVVTPKYTPSSGLFGGFGIIEISTFTDGADVYYTTDGSTPTTQNGTLVTDDILITETTTFKARGFKAGSLPSDVATATFTVVPLSVTATPAGGEFLIGSLTPIVLEANNETATSYYTVDGSEPTEASTLFDSAIPPFDENTLLRWRAFDAPAAPSAIGSAQYNIKLKPPVVTPTDGQFITEKLVAFSTPVGQGGRQFASFNGAPFVDVTDSAELFTVTTNWIAESRDTNNVTSDQISGTIEIKCASPTVSPLGGQFEIEQEINITTNEPLGTTHYTTNGATPTESDPTTTPFDITATSTVKARTFRAGTTPSDVVEVSYELVEVARMLFGDPTPISRKTVDNWATFTAYTSPIYGLFASGDDFKWLLQSVADVFHSSINGLNTIQSLTPPRPTGNQALSLWGVNRDMSCIIATNTGTNFGIYRSLDFGANWTRLVPPSDISRTYNGCQISDDRQIILIGGQTFGANPSKVAGIYRSTNGGASFTLVSCGTTSNTNGSFWNLALNRTGSRTLERVFCLVFDISVSRYRLYRSTDFGATWSLNYDVAGIEAQIAVSDDAMTCYLIVSGDILKSTDGGDSWSSMGLSGVISGSLSCNATGQVVMYGANVGYFISLNGLTSSTNFFSTNRATKRTNAGR